MFQKNLVVWKLYYALAALGNFFLFQKNLVVWKRISGLYVAMRLCCVSEELSSVETFEFWINLDS